jgi:hypothetical protein
MTERLHRLLGAVPADPTLRERCLHRIVRRVEIASHLLPRDEDYRELRTRHPGLPELTVPDSFHVRAYELAERKLAVSLRNAAAFPLRTPHVRTQIAAQIDELFAGARRALLAKAVGPAAERAVNEDAPVGVQAHGAADGEPVAALERAPDVDVPVREDPDRVHRARSCARPSYVRKGPPTYTSPLPSRAGRQERTSSSACCSRYVKAPPGPGRPTYSGGAPLAPPASTGPLPPELPAAPGQEHRDEQGERPDPTAPACGLHATSQGTRLLVRRAGFSA